METPDGKGTKRKPIVIDDEDEVLGDIVNNGYKPDKRVKLLALTLDDDNITPVLMSIILNLPPISIKYLCSVSKKFRDYCKKNIPDFFWMAVLIGDFLQFTPLTADELFETITDHIADAEIKTGPMAIYISFIRRFLETRAIDEGYYPSEHNAQFVRGHTSDLLHRKVFSYAFFGSRVNDFYNNVIGLLVKYNLYTTDANIVEKVNDLKKANSSDIELVKQFDNALKILVPHTNFMNIRNKYYLGAFFHINATCDLAKGADLIEARLNVNDMSFALKPKYVPYADEETKTKNRLRENIQSMFRYLILNIAVAGGYSTNKKIDPFWFKSQYLTINEPKNAIYSIQFPDSPESKGPNAYFRRKTCMHIQTQHPSERGENNNSMVLTSKFSVLDFQKDPDLYLADLFKWGSLTLTVLFYDRPMHLESVYDTTNVIEAIVDDACKSIHVALEHENEQYQGALQQLYTKKAKKFALETEQQGCTKMIVAVRPIPMSFDGVIERTNDVSGITPNKYSDKLVIGCGLYDITSGINQESYKLVGFCDVYYKQLTVIDDAHSRMTFSINNIAITTLSIVKTGACNPLLGVLPHARNRQLILKKYTDMAKEEMKAKKEEEKAKKEEEESLLLDAPFEVTTKGRLGKTLTDSNITIESMKILGKESFVMYDNNKDDLYCNHIHSSFNEISEHLESGVTTKSFCPKCVQSV
jgi:hypothetical protein